MRRDRLLPKLHTPAWYVLAAGLFISATLFCAMIRYEQASEQSNFVRRAQFRVAALENGMLNAIDALQVVNQLFIMNGDVTREQFHAFVAPLRQRYPYIEAFTFHRLIDQSERAAYEARTRLQFPGFTITDIVDGKRVVAATRAHYPVIDYIEPMSSHERAFGVDAAQHSVSDADVSRTAENGLPSANGLFRITAAADT